MIKNKLDFKLINIAIIAIIVFLVYSTGRLWGGILGIIGKIVIPFFLAFVFAYALHPLMRFLMNKKIPKGVCIFLIVALVFGILGLLGILVIPLLVDQLSSLFNSIISFLKGLSLEHDLNIGPIQDSLSKTFNDIIVTLGKYVSNGAVNIIGSSLSMISTAFIAFSAAMYFLADMDNIRAHFKKYLLKKSKRAYQYIDTLDTEMKNYLTGFLKVAFISFIEYTLAYYIIGHPNALLLGFLSAVAGLIPYFGGIIVNIVACVTSIVVSPTLFIATLVLVCILSVLDGNLIGPFVYGKTNKVHPLYTIFAVFAGGILFGLMGVIISLPLAIIIQATYKFFRKDISNKLEDMKGTKKAKS